MHEAHFNASPRENGIGNDTPRMCNKINIPPSKNESSKSPSKAIKRSRLEIIAQF